MSYTCEELAAADTVGTGGGLAVVLGCDVGCCFFGAVDTDDCVVLPVDLKCIKTENKIEWHVFTEIKYLVNTTSFCQIQFNELSLLPTRIYTIVTNYKLVQSLIIVREVLNFIFSWCTSTSLSWVEK